MNARTPQKAPPKAKRYTHTMKALSGAFDTKGSTMTPWIHLDFAEGWFGDARREAGKDGRAARRREVVFAVTAAECFLFEWTRDQVLQSHHHDLDTYFPAVPPKGKFLSVLQKWRTVPTKLKGAGKIANTPKLDKRNAAWCAFETLVDYRNGLVHGRAGRPDTPGLSPLHRPKPNRHDLDGMAPGWAINVVHDLMKDLVRAGSVGGPKWLGRRRPYVRRPAKGRTGSVPPTRRNNSGRSNA